MTTQNMVKINTIVESVLVLPLLSLPYVTLSKGYAFHHVQRKEIHRPLQHKTAQAKRDPATVVPTIARLLGVRVGYNGQEVLERKFGSGLALTGGHPGGRKLWYTRHPSGYIETDGFDVNREGLALESLSWKLDPAIDPKIPFVRHLPRHPRWLGVVDLGMAQRQVSKLTARGLPAPQKSGDVWIWKAKGFVRPNPTDYDIYTLWTAKLTFRNGRLVSIDVDCAGGLSAP